MAATLTSTPTRPAGIGVRDRTAEGSASARRSSEGTEWPRVSGAEYRRFLAGYLTAPHRRPPGPIGTPGQAWAATPIGPALPPVPHATFPQPAGSAFWIETEGVSNERFATFVGATSHVTDAELSGFSFAFTGPAADVVGSTHGVAGTEPWRKVPGADWRHPAGPGSTVVDRLDQPVVHVSWRDAQAFCAWAGLRLPTGLEWELTIPGAGGRCWGGLGARPAPPRWEWTANRYARHGGDHEPPQDDASDPAERRWLRRCARRHHGLGVGPDAGSTRMAVGPRFSSGNVGFRCLHERP